MGKAAPKVKGAIDVDVGGSMRCTTCGAFANVPSDLRWREYGYGDVEQTFDCANCATQYEVNSCDGSSAIVYVAVVQREHLLNRPANRTGKQVRAIAKADPNLSQVMKLAEQRRDIERKLAQAMAEASDAGHSVRAIGKAATLGKSRVAQIIAAIARPSTTYTDDIPF